MVVLALVMGAFTMLVGILVGVALERSKENR